MKESKSKNNIVECPKCEEKATITSTTVNMMTASFVCIILMVISMFIPTANLILVPIMLILFMILFIISIVSIFTGGGTIVCKHCNSKYKLNKEEYKRYKA